jgi:hypothetical protein
MMGAMDGFQVAEGEVGVHLGGGNVGVAEQYLDAAQICPVFDHVRGAAVAKFVRTGGAVARFDESPDPLAGERLASFGEKKPGLARFAAGFRSTVGEIGF